MESDRTGNEDVLLAFNPLGHPHTTVLQACLPDHLMVPAGHTPPEVHLSSSVGKTVPAQMAEDGRSLFFSALVPAAGMARFTLAAATAGRSATQWPNVTATAPRAPLENAALRLTFGSDGALDSITNLNDSVVVKTAQSYYNYETTQGGPVRLGLHIDLVVLVSIVLSVLLVVLVFIVSSSTSFSSSS